jgi:hypothetical protein
MNFQKLIIVIAILTLSILLVVIGVTLSKAKTNVNWPPIIGECPDYWTDLKGNGEGCFNSRSLGKCNIPKKDNDNTMNFNESPFIGVTGLCSKYKWAKSCNVTWDGITSGVKNPCDLQEPTS